jgi:hypothetical protein
MLEFYSTPLDVLYFSLTIVVSVLGLFLIIAVYHLIKILANVNSVTTKAKDTMDLVNHYLWQPIKFAMMIIEKSKAAAAASKHRKAKKSETDNAV